MRRVYIETSVWGMAAPGQNLALRQPTLEFLRQCERRVFSPCISAVVADEIRQAPRKVQRAILARLSKLNPAQIPLPPEADELARRFLAQGVLPGRRMGDARHVACALVNGIGLVVSWNYRHLANVRKAEAFNAVAVLAGFAGGLQIHTPLEVLEWKER